MSGPYNSASNPRLGATFYPGAVDDYQMPEVISPAPQRVMPEVPENMQDNLAHLEQEGSGPARMASYHQPQFPSRNSSIPSHGYVEPPNFSPFPVLHDPPSNVPPSDEQREANLEHGRLAVLASNDPDMQLSWAQDALSHVEVSMQNELRMSAIQPPRPGTPQVEHQLKSDAINVVTFLSEQRHPHAEFIRGMWLEFGKFGFRVDKKEAFLCYSRAAEKGYARAEYRIGMQFESSNEPLKAIKHYEKGVSLGDSASYYRLGMMILLGQHGQAQNYAAGLEYIRFAAQTCDENAPQGAYVYGMLLARELPQVVVPEEFLQLDIDASRVNIEKAAYHGFAKAQVKMGAAYELCQLGCDFNPALSLHYNALAARQGESEAEMAISKWFLCGHEGLFEKNDEMAFTYAKRAAQGGLATAEFALGYFYEIGIFVPVDIKEARTWYAKAAASGNKDASSRIDSISRSKTLSRKDHEKVAIARIKSQYASHGRGEQRRVPAAAPGLEPVQDTLEMPDPSRMAISSQDQTGSRSTSAAPYPDTPQYGPPGSANQYGERSSSAFGINPNLRAQQPNPRASSGGFQGYPQQSNPGMGMPPGPQYGNGQGPGAPQMDIGYSAPHDRRRLQRPGSANPPQAQGPPGGAPDFRQSRVPSSPNPSAGRQSAQGSPGPGSHPPRSESTPAKSPGAAPGRPATKSTPAALPGKGPKTFEEMGVPQGKKDGDCVVM